MDYLIEEVLHLQPEPIRHFLLQTSILDRLNGALCDAVMHGTGSQKTLETLERSNLFVVALDDERSWYRYHHLFADALRTYLHSESPNDLQTLHLRASDWYMRNDLPQDAIRHALASGDLHLAADLLEQIWPIMNENYQTAIWLEWAKTLPETHIRNRPLLCADLGWAMILIGELEVSESWLEAAERWLTVPEVDRQSMRVADEWQFTLLPASISSARTYRSLALGDIPATLHYAQQALDYVGNADHPSRTQVTALSGIARWANGDLAAADQILSDFVIEMQTVGRMVDAIELVFIIADIRITCGRLNDAYRTYEQAFQLLSDLGNPLLMGIEDLHRGVSELYREWNRLDAAEDHLLAAEELSEQLIMRPDWRHRLSLSWARLKIAQGDLDTALKLLDDADEHYIRTPLPVVRSAAAMRARIWIQQGKLDAAQDWVIRQGLSTDEATAYLHEFDLITLARLLLAQYRINRSDRTQQSVFHLLERLRDAAQVGGRTGSLIEVLILQALAHDAHGDTSAALNALEHALRLAESQGYIRLFIDEGGPMQALLKQATRQSISPDYVCQLLATFDGVAREPRVVQPLIEPLSERELDVLQLLHTDMTGPEIARKLIISLSTLRTHTRNIYSKLDVNSRRAAVRRAEELSLL